MEGFDSSIFLQSFLKHNTRLAQHNFRKIIQRPIGQIPERFIVTRFIQSVIPSREITFLIARNENRCCCTQETVARRGERGERSINKSHHRRVFVLFLTPNRIISRPISAVNRPRITRRLQPWLLFYSAGLERSGDNEGWGWSNGDACVIAAFLRPSNADKG